MIVFLPSRQNDLSLRRRGTARLFDTERKSCRSIHPLYGTKLNVRYTLFPDCYYPCANRRLLARINDPKLVIVSRLRSRDRNQPEQSALSLRVPNDDRGRFRVIVNLSLQRRDLQLGQHILLTQLSNEVPDLKIVQPKNEAGNGKTGCQSPRKKRNRNDV